MKRCAVSVVDVHENIAPHYRPASVHDCEDVTEEDVLTLDVVPPVNLKGYIISTVVNYIIKTGHSARVVNGLDLNLLLQSSNGFGLARSNRVCVVTTLFFCFASWLVEHCRHFFAYPPTCVRH
jgi:hypothetical protein